MIVRMSLAALIVATGMLFAGCSARSDNTPVTITIGMSFAEVEAGLRRCGAEKVMLAMAPPSDSDGNYLELANFEVGQDTTISIVIDRTDSPAIVSMSICHHTEKGKDEQEWRPLETYIMHPR